MYSRDHYKRALQACFMAENISGILKKVIDASLAAAYARDPFLQSWLELVSRPEYPGTMVKNRRPVGSLDSMIDLCGHHDSGKYALDDLDSLMRQSVLSLPRPSRSLYASSSTRTRANHPAPLPGLHEYIDANGVALLDFWALAPLLSTASLSRQQELQLLWW